MPCRIVDIGFPRTPIRKAEDLLASLRQSVERACAEGKAALALSGGIDSAILAKLMPPGSKAFTFHCVVPGKDVIDETAQARKWADICGLEQEIIDIRWEDIEGSVDRLMRHKGAPIHSIEAQIYLAASRAKEQGFDTLIFGENADIIYGGMDGLLKKDWLFGEFADRYSYVSPYHALRDPVMILEPFREFETDGHIDAHAFINRYFRQEALGTYHNACETAGIRFAGPYSETTMDIPLDLQRIRSGDTKYLVREVFRLLYPGESMPAKIPMPRPVNEWFADWPGPKRPEFFPHCTDDMSGDQRWMIWALERFLNLLETDGKDKTE
ncbi:MAG: asparagine synthase C-terminal domain-containing protein [Lachnospiraceae bacterium]|nr:asparagine synthase C-terminal domain-containing protein [Lachnospiraceae bacterium]